MTKFDFSLNGPVPAGIRMLHLVALCVLLFFTGLLLVSIGVATGSLLTFTVGIVDMVVVAWIVIAL